jgi:ribosomal protein L22
MISVDESKTLKRAQFGSRGRVSRINKRRSHLNLELKVK